MGVGYIIGPKLGALNFSGGLLAWGLMAPMILYFLIPDLNLTEWATFLMSKDTTLTAEQAMAKVSDPSFQINSDLEFHRQADRNRRNACQRRHLPSSK